MKCANCGNEVKEVQARGGTRYYCNNCKKMVKVVQQGAGGQEKAGQEQETQEVQGWESPESEEEVREEEKEPPRAEVPTTRKEIADDFGVWRRIYIPYDVLFAFNRVKGDGLTECKDFQSWLVECVDLALEYAYRRRIVFEQVLSKDGKLKWIKDQGFTKEQLEGLLKIGSITKEEFNTLVGSE